MTRHYADLPSDELATAILTHEVRPTNEAVQASTFAEEIKDELSGPRPRNSLELVDALEAMEKNSLTEDHRNAMTHGLEVIAAMQQAMEMTRTAAQNAPIATQARRRVQNDLTGTELIAALAMAEHTPPPAEEEEPFYVKDEDVSGDEWKPPPDPNVRWTTRHHAIAEDSAKLANLREIGEMLRTLAHKENIPLVEPPEPGRKRK